MNREPLTVRLRRKASAYNGTLRDLFNEAADQIEEQEHHVSYLELKLDDIRASQIHPVPMTSC